MSTSFKKREVAAQDLGLGVRICDVNGLWRSVSKVTPIKDTNMVRITMGRGHVWDVPATQLIPYQARA